jgi:hypothetical protein
MIKLIATAVISLALGAGGTLATLHVTATCDVAQVEPVKPLLTIKPGTPFIIGNNPRY